MDIQHLIQDKGYFINQVTGSVSNNIAPLVLHSSLESYFQTAEDLEFLFSEKSYKTLSVQEEIDDHGSSYAAHACDAILGFHHFLELFLKEVLLEIDKLMVYDVSKKPLLLHKILKAPASVSDSDLDKVNFIECKVAMDRVRALQNSGMLDPKYSFLTADYFTMFDAVNTLRNRIIHRGTFIIDHTGLDELFGKYIIPFLIDLESLPNYKGLLENNYQLNNTAINPYQEIKQEYSQTNPNEEKIYLLKSVASAAFKNTLNKRLNPNDPWAPWLDDRREQAEKYAAEEAEKELNRIHDCPVCDCKTLIEEIEYEESENPKTGATIQYKHTYRVRCIQCEFHIECWLLPKVITYGLPLLNYYNEY